LLMDLDCMIVKHDFCVLVLIHAACERVSCAFLYAAAGYFRDKNCVSAFSVSLTRSGFRL
jgi:hypothetical protein